MADASEFRWRERSGFVEFTGAGGEGGALRARPGGGRGRIGEPQSRPGTDLIGGAERLDGHATLPPTCNAKNDGAAVAVYQCRIDRVPGRIGPTLCKG